MCNFAFDGSNDRAKEKLNYKSKKKKMKKYIALLLGLVFGLGFVSCSSDDDDDENISGEGKYLAEMTVTRYDWKDGKRSDEGKIYQRYEYNEKEQLVCQESPFFGYRQTPIYNDNGDCIEQKFYSYKTDEYLGYDKRDFNQVDSVFIIHSYNWKNELVSTTKYEYTYGYKLIRETEIIDSIGKDHGKVWTYSYSGNTETIEITNLKDGSLIEKQVNDLDSYGNTTKMTLNIFYDFAISPVTYEYTFKYDYDSQGKILRQTHFTGSAGYTEYTYNNDGTIQKEHYAIGLNTDFEEIYDLEYTYKYKKK